MFMQMLVKRIKILHDYDDSDFTRVSHERNNSNKIPLVFQTVCQGYPLRNSNWLLLNRYNGE